jgi:hypothetical protein
MKTFLFSCTPIQISTHPQPIDSKLISFVLLPQAAICISKLQEREDLVEVEKWYLGDGLQILSSHQVIS